MTEMLRYIDQKLADLVVEAGSYDIAKNLPPYCADFDMLRRIRAELVRHSKKDYKTIAETLCEAIRDTDEWCNGCPMYDPKAECEMRR